MFKSKISSQLRSEKKWHIIGFVLIILVSNMFLSLFPFMRPPINPFISYGRFYMMPLIPESIPFYLITSIQFLLIIWFVMQYFGSYLIIYSDGLGIAEPYRFKIHKFIPWHLIKEISIFEKDTIRRDRYNYYGAIYFFLKDSQKSLRVSELWADNIYKAYEIMSKYVKPPETPKFCKNHPQIETVLQCSSCGAYFCKECIEIKEFYDWNEIMGSGRVYQKCITCNFNVGLKRMAIIYLIALIIPIVAIFLLYFNLFIDLDNYLYNEIFSEWYIPFFGNIPGIFTTFYAIVSVLLIAPTPYAYAFNIINLIKARKMERLKINYKKKTLIFLTISAVFIISYYSIWFIQLHIAWFGGYLIWVAIMGVGSFLYEFWGLILSD